MMEVNNEDQSFWCSNSDEDIHHTTPPETAATNPYIDLDTNDYCTENSVLNITASHAASEDDVDQAIDSLILEKSNPVATQTIICHSRKKPPEVKATSTSDKKAFGGPESLHLETLLDPCLRNQNVRTKKSVTQTEPENFQSSRNLDFDYIKRLQYCANAPEKPIISLDFEYIIKAQDWYHGDSQEILFWYEGFDIKIFAESCRRSYKFSIKVSFVAKGTRLDKRERLFKMAFHLKEARKHVYRDFDNVLRGTTLSEDFLEAVDDLYQKQQCAHNTVFNDKIQYDVGYKFDNERGNIILEGVQDIDSLMIDIMLDHFRHQEAQKFQEKGSVIRKLMRERRCHQTTKAIVVNYDLGESIKGSWDSLIDSDTFENKSIAQEIANDGVFEATPQAKISVTHNKGSKSSTKKKNKRKPKPAEVENLSSNVLGDDNSVEEANKSNYVTDHSEVTDYGVKSPTAMDDALDELSRSASTARVQDSTDNFGEGKPFVNTQPTTKNDPLSQDSELFVPLTEAPTSPGDPTIEDSMTSRPRGRSNSIRTKSGTDVEGNGAVVRDESLGAAQKRLKDHTPVPTRDSTEQAKVDARRVRANSISMIRKRTMSRTMNRPNLAELGTISGILDAKESAVIDDQEEVANSNKIHEIMKAPRVFEVEETVETYGVANGEIVRILDIEDIEDSASEIIHGDKNTPPASDSDDDHLLDTSERNLQSKQRHVAPLPETQEVFQIKPPTTPKTKKSKTKRKSKAKGNKNQQPYKNVDTTLKGILQDEDFVYKLSEEDKKPSTIQPSKGKPQKLEDPKTEAEAHIFLMKKKDLTIKAEMELFRGEKDNPVAGHETERSKLKKDVLFANGKDTSKTTMYVAQKAYATKALEEIQDTSETVKPTGNTTKSTNALEVTDTRFSTIGSISFDHPDPLRSTQETEEHNQLAQEKPKISNKELTEIGNPGNSGEIEALVGVVNAASKSLYTESTDHEDYVTIAQKTITRLVAQMPESHTEVRDVHLSKVRAVSAELKSLVVPVARDALQRSRSMDAITPLTSIKNEHQIMEHSTDNYLGVLANIAGTHPLVNCFLYGSRYKCAYCSAQTFESYSEVSPAIICPGCGPCSYIRYCSRSCALLDSYEHCRICSRTFESYPIIWDNLPLRYHQLIPAIVPVNGYYSPELFRQMAYSWHCHDDNDYPIHLLEKWGEINFPEDQASYLKLFGPAGPEAQLTGDYFLFQCLPSDPHETRPFVTFQFKYSDEFNRTLNCCFLDNNQYKLLEFLYRMIWNELNVPDGMTVLYPEDASKISHEFQHQFWLEFKFSPSHCNNRARFEFEHEWNSVKNIVDKMERRHPMLRAWRRDSLDQVPANPWDRFFGKSWPPTPPSPNYLQYGETKKLVVPRDSAKFFHQGWTGHQSLPPDLLEDCLLDGY